MVLALASVAAISRSPGRWVLLADLWVVSEHPHYTCSPLQSESKPPASFMLIELEHVRLGHARPSATWKVLDSSHQINGGSQPKPFVLLATQLTHYPIHFFSNLHRASHHSSRMHLCFASNMELDGHLRTPNSEAQCGTKHRKQKFFPASCDGAFQHPNSDNIG
jgi:hypothetical protein